MTNELTAEQVRNMMPHDNFVEAKKELLVLIEVAAKEGKIKIDHYLHEFKNEITTEQLFQIGRELRDLGFNVFFRANIFDVVIAIQVDWIKKEETKRTFWQKWF